MSVSVLGEIRVNEVILNGAIARRLMSALVIRRGTEVGADFLSEVAWPDRLDPGATALHSQISRLRARLGVGSITRSERGYRLELAPSEIDVSLFERDVENARRSVEATERLGWLDDAIQRWRGTPYAECGDDHFALADRAHLNVLYTESQNRRLATLAELERHDEVVAAWSAVFGESTADDHVAATTARSLAKLGRTRDGLALLQTHRTNLRENAGLEVGPMILEAEQVLLTEVPVQTGSRNGPSTPSAHPLESGPSITPTLSPWRGIPRETQYLIGRHRARRLLARAVDDTVEGRGSVISLVGPAGAGKTRLLDHVAEQATDRSLFVERFSASLAPLGHELLDDIATTLGVLGPDRQDTPSSDAALRVHRRAVDVSQSLISGISQPTVVLVDDLHQADNLTVTGLRALKHQLEIRRCPLLVVVGSRTAIEDLEEVELGPMSIEDTSLLVAEILGHRPAPRLVETAWRLSEGWPFGVVAGLRSLGATRQLVLVDDEVDLAESAPRAVFDANSSASVDGQLAPLTSDEQQLLIQLALLRPGCRVVDASLLLATPVADMLATLDAAERAGLASLDDDRVVFSHDNMRRHIADRATTAARMALNDAAVERLGQPTNDAEVLNMAWHAAGSSSPERSRTVLRDAALLSAKRCDWERALRYFDLSSDQRGPDPTVAVLAGEAAFRTFGAAEADRWFARGAKRARNEGNIDGLARCVVGRERARLTAVGGGAVDQAALEEVAENTDGHYEAEARVCGLLAEVCFADRRIEQAKMWTERALVASGRADEPGISATANFSAGLTALGALDLTTAARRFDVSRQGAAEAGDVWVTAWVTTRQALCALVSGDLDSATVFMRTALEACERASAEAEMTLVLGVEATLALIRGDVDGALVIAADAESLWHRARYPFSAPLVFPILAECWRRCESPADAIAALDRWAGSGVGGSTPWRILHLCKVGRIEEATALWDDRPLSAQPGGVQLVSAHISSISATFAATANRPEVSHAAIAELRELSAAGVTYVPGFAVAVKEILVSASLATPSVESSND